ncbi:HEAT repeat domain-containing protein, partial [Singulisphaera rosea]
PVLPVEEAEAKSWINVLSAVRTGFPKFGGYGRVTALLVTAKVLNRFSVETAPPSWTKVLPLTSDIFISGMVAPEIDVKVNALLEVGKLWGWTPGKTPEPLEEDALGEWKSSLLRSATGRCMGDIQPKVRAAAVACLGNLPIDEVVKPAVACLEDTRKGAGEVRRQVLISFARRRTLLSEDAVLKLLYDPEPGIPEMAEIVLKTRGLTNEQINLGRMIFHPKPELRSSVITLLRDRTDIDPVVWLLQLSHDSDESVRANAVEALSSKLSPEVRRRLAEMAKTD